MKRAIYIVSSMDAGGAETVFMKYYRALDKSKYQIDFCVSSPDKGFYDDEIIGLGGRIVHTVKKSESGPYASFMRLREIAREGRYCCAVRSSQNSISAFDLLAMKAGGVPKTVFRSSNTGTVHGTLQEKLFQVFFRPLVGAASTLLCAPSLGAGRYMFGESGLRSDKFTLLHNALNLSEYAYSRESRRLIRRELGIPESAFVIGHVGRFNQQKNHPFLIKVFSKVARERDDAVLLLFGKGELEGDIRRDVKERGLSQKVIFAGVRNDMGKCYSAMDVLLFPSLYEGLPNAVIEAQANGLPCIISETITRDVAINSNVYFLSVNEQIDSWVRAIKPNCIERVGGASNRLREAGYDIEIEIRRFIDLLYQ